MNKWHGVIGFAETTETVSGVWQESITEYEYYGDVLSNRFGYQTSGVNDDVTISNRISIMADPFAYANAGSMKYVTFVGAKWKVNSIEYQYPRLILDIGGVYNG